MPTTYESRLFVKVKTPRLRAGRWNTEQESLSDWPIFLSRGGRTKTPSRELASLAGAVRDRDLWDLTYPPRNGLWFFEILDEADLKGELRGTLFRGDEGQLPQGDCLVVASFLVHNGSAFAHRTPFKAKSGQESERASMLRQAGLDSVSPFGPYGLRGAVDADIITDDENWLKHLRYDLGKQLPRESRPPMVRWAAAGQQLETFNSADVTPVPIVTGSVTTIRIEIPDDLESRIRLVSDASQPEAAKAAWEAGYPFLRPAKITVVGTAPLPPAE